MTLSIIRAEAADAPALVAAQVAAFHSDSVIYPGVELGGPPGYDSVEVMTLKIAEDDAYTFRLDGRIVGGMVIYDNGNGRYHLDVIFIDPAHHNQGIGSQAMTFLDTAYPAAHSWTLNTPAWAIRNHHFYEKFGFRRTGESEWGGVPLLDYEKRR
jgi:GNAT superfamily N-acetyltransferase